MDNLKTAIENLNDAIAVNDTAIKNLKNEISIAKRDAKIRHVIGCIIACIIVFLVFLLATTH